MAIYISETVTAYSVNRYTNVYRFTLTIRRHPHSTFFLVVSFFVTHSLFFIYCFCYFFIILHTTIYKYNIQQGSLFGDYTNTTVYKVKGKNSRKINLLISTRAIYRKKIKKFRMMLSNPRQINFFLLSSALQVGHFMPVKQNINNLLMPMVMIMIIKYNTVSPMKYAVKLSP